MPAWFGQPMGLRGLVGRDYFARVVAGARLSITLALNAMAIGAGFALVLGMTSAYAAGLFDLLSQRELESRLDPMPSGAERDSRSRLE